MAGRKQEANKSQTWPILTFLPTTPSDRDSASPIPTVDSGKLMDVVVRKYLTR